MTCPVGLLRGSAVPETGLLPVPLTRGIQRHTPGGGGGGPPYIFRRLNACLPPPLPFRVSQALSKTPVHTTHPPIQSASAPGGVHH